MTRLFPSTQPQRDLSGMLCPVLGLPVKESHGHIGVGPVEGREHNRGVEASVIQGEVAGAEVLQPGEEKAQEDLTNVYNT